MKKFLARLSLLGLFAGLAATSFSVPASAAVTDQNAAYEGPSTNMAEREIVIIIIDTPDYIYYVEYYEYYGAAAQAAGAPSAALTDAAFDR
jgi:hypothetical protein